MMKEYQKSILLPLLLLFVFGIAASTQLEKNRIGNSYYVAVDGSDEAEGTKDDPWASVERALSEAGPGDTILLRGGVYRIKRAVQLGDALGTDDGWITIRSYPGERAVFDAYEFRETEDGLTPHRAGLGSIEPNF